jgi:hypothetical protein
VKDLLARGASIQGRYPPGDRVSTGNNSALSTSLRIDRTCPPRGSGTRPLASTSCQPPGKASNCGIPRLTLGNRLGSENAMSPEPRVSTGNNSALSTSLRIDRTCPPPSTKRSPCPGCERWYDLHDELHWELQCNPWEWPCVARQSPKRAGSVSLGATAGQGSRAVSHLGSISGKSAPQDRANPRQSPEPAPPSRAKPPP